MSNLITRVISAFFALVVLWTIIYFFESTGLVVFCVLIATVGLYEMSLLLFRSGFPKYAKTVFFILGLVNLLVASLKDMSFQSPLLVSTFSVIVVVSLILHKTFSSVDQILLFVSKFVMGIIYAACLPALVISLVQSSHGILWFLCLLTVIFSGDTGAYVFGTLFGKTKIAPLLSPKKSLQGSFGGLLFSSLAGLGFSFIIPEASPILMIILGFLGGVLGQSGDFFESLVKRVAGVKDSGFIMPGHGGVLDRIDGVYFASPLFYIAVNYII